MAHKPGCEVVFRGKLVRGADPQVVRNNLCRLFKTTPEKIERLFQGGRHVLKSGLSHEQAHHYRDVLKKAGAIVVVVDREAKADMQALRPERTKPASAAGLQQNTTPQPQAANTPAETQSGNEESDLLAPVGAPVNDPQPPVPEPEFDLSPYALDEPGVVIIEPEPRPEPSIDISHMRIDDSDRPHEPPKQVEPPRVDVDALSFAADDSPLEPPRDTSPPEISLSHLQLVQLEGGDEQDSMKQES